MSPQKKREKSKISNHRLRILIIPPVIILCITLQLLVLAANQYHTYFDSLFGRGERHVESLEDGAQQDAKYYNRCYDSPEDSRLAASQVAQKVLEEGAVLLKNKDNVLPLEGGSRVTPLGYRYVSPYYGGSGSANVDTSAAYIVSPQEALQGHFEVNQEIVARMKKASPQTMLVNSVDTGQNLSTFDPAIYAGSEASCHGTTGIVFIGRPSMEGYDYNSQVPYEDGTETQLELTQNEKATIAYAKANCDQVVIILNCATPIQMVSLEEDAGVDAILWIGLPGSRGYEAMAKILEGQVNPSGKTSAIWYADLKSDPTFVNAVTTAYTNPVEDGPAYYTEYAEGIYMGYRYYETRFAEDNTFPVFGETKTYDEAVVYPFGYGLNYEDAKVTQTLDRVSEADGLVTVKGTVNNQSSRAVGEVVQVYYGAPYTAGSIEKSAKELVEFTKVQVEAGQSQDFTVTFNLEDMASYDYKKRYSEKGSYVLEAGDYSIYLGQDSHDTWGQALIHVPESLVYANQAKKGRPMGKRSTDQTLAENLFEDLNAYEKRGQMTVMSRRDFAGTFPSPPEEKPISPEVLSDIQDFDYLTDHQLGEREGSLLYHAEPPLSNENNGIQLSSLRGLDYDDPAWEDLLDNLDYKSPEIGQLLTKGMYTTGPLSAIGKIETLDHDGPLGLTATWGGDIKLAFKYNTITSHVVACSYPCGGIQAATWNRQVMRQMGQMVGEEALSNKISGWYAPGLNLHRTPYSGRTFEYYSEDPVLTGILGAQVISGAFEKGGLYTYIKHFILNETDQNRSSVSVWANEQVCRQLYFKAFELCIENAMAEEKYYDPDAKAIKTLETNACRGIMTSMNYVGTASPTNSYTLLTALLRNEWGFKGMVVTDFTSGTYKDKNVGYRVGNDLWMGLTAESIDLQSPSAKWAARNAVHHIAYVVVNSNAYNGVLPGAYVYYDQSPWMTLLLIADGFMTLGLLGVLIIVLHKTRPH